LDSGYTIPHFQVYKRKIALTFHQQSDRLRHVLHALRRQKAMYHKRAQIKIMFRKRLVSNRLWASILRGKSEERGKGREGKRKRGREKRKGRKVERMSYGYQPLPAIANNWTHGVAPYHDSYAYTTAPINHTKPSPHSL